MQCWIYKSGRREETYLYLAEELAEQEQSTQIPEQLADMLGSLEFVMQLALTPERILARANVEQVMKDLRERGYYLQLPPPDPQTEDRLQ